MKKRARIIRLTGITIAAGALALAASQQVFAHCDTLDGPVIRDARRALDKRSVTPVLKWVGPADEATVKRDFESAIGAKGERAEAARQNFFETLVRVHRAGEGAPFTGLKPPGSVEPAVAAVDSALEKGSWEILEKHIPTDARARLRKDFAPLLAAYRERESSVQKGRGFVHRYVEFTHRVEAMAGEHGGHGEHGHEKRPEPHGGGHGH